MGKLIKKTTNKSCNRGPKLLFVLKISCTNIISIFKFDPFILETSTKLAFYLFVCFEVYWKWIKTNKCYYLWLLGFGFCLLLLLPNHCAKTNWCSKFTILCIFNATNRQQKVKWATIWNGIVLMHVFFLFAFGFFGKLNF